MSPKIFNEAPEYFFLLSSVATIEHMRLTNSTILIKFSITIVPPMNNFNTVKPVNKGHPRERQDMVFIDKWSLIGCYFVLFYQ